MSWRSVTKTSFSSRFVSFHRCSRTAQRLTCLPMTLQIEAEALPDISESFEVDAVPYFILLRVRTFPLLPFSPPPILTSSTHTGPHPPHPPLRRSARRPLRRHQVARLEALRPLLLISAAGCSADCLPTGRASNRLGGRWRVDWSGRRGGGGIRGK